jgi:hypothetical protein
MPQLPSNLETLNLTKVEVSKSSQLLAPIGLPARKLHVAGAFLLSARELNRNDLFNCGNELTSFSMLPCDDGDTWVTTCV